VADLAPVRRTAGIPLPSPPQTRPRQTGVSRRQTRQVEPYLEPGRRQKDEQKARELGLSPEDVKKIVDMSMEEFNDFSQKKGFDEDKLSILRDMRRRGKNKVAAQNCRKRKLETIEQLQGRVEDLKEKLKENKRQEKKKELEKETEIERGHLIINELKARGKVVGCHACTVFTESCMYEENCRVSVSVRV